MSEQASPTEPAPDQGVNTDYLTGKAELPPEAYGPDGKFDPEFAAVRPDKTPAFAGTTEAEAVTGSSSALDGEYEYTDEQLETMPDHVREGITAAKEAANASAVIDSVPGMPKDEHTQPARGRSTIPKEQWTPAMRRRAADAAGNMVKDPTSGMPIDTPKIVHPGQLGKNTEG